MITRPNTTRRGPGPRRPAMRPCVSNIPGSNANWPISCGTTTGAATMWADRRVKVQYLLTGLVVNVKRMVKLLDAQGAQPARQPA